MSPSLSGPPSPGPSSSPGPTPSRVATPQPRTEEYLPGLGADIYEPTEPRTGAVVVLIPGGGWLSANRSGLAPLAIALARSGVMVVNATYRTRATGTYFPAPLEDVTCAVAFAAARGAAAAAGAAPHPLVVVGHSAGANLAALAALTPDRAASCPYPAAAADAFVGMAGPYDVDQLPAIAISLFGAPADADPGLWADGNPVRQAASRPDVPVLLLHGRADSVVPVKLTTDFAAALRAGGHQVIADLVPGVDHSGIYHADVAAVRLVSWIGALP